MILGEKSLAAQGNWTCVSNVPVWCSIDWATPHTFSSSQRQKRDNSHCHECWSQFQQAKVQAVLRKRTRKVDNTETLILFLFNIFRLCPLGLFCSSAVTWCNKRTWWRGETTKPYTGAFARCTDSSAAPATAISVSHSFPVHRYANPLNYLLTQQDKPMRHHHPFYLLPLLTAFTACHTLLFLSLFFKVWWEEKKKKTSGEYGCVANELLSSTKKKEKN